MLGEGVERSAQELILALRRYSQSAFEHRIGNFDSGTLAAAATIKLASKIIDDGGLGAALGETILSFLSDPDEIIDKPASASEGINVAIGRKFGSRNGTSGQIIEARFVAEYGSFLVEAIHNSDVADTSLKVDEAEVLRVRSRADRRGEKAMWRYEEPVAFTSGDWAVALLSLSAQLRANAQNRRLAARSDHLLKAAQRFDLGSL